MDLRTSEWREELRRAAERLLSEVRQHLNDYGCDAPYQDFCRDIEFVARAYLATADAGERLAGVAYEASREMLRAADDMTSEELRHDLLVARHRLERDAAAICIRAAAPPPPARAAGEETSRE